MDAALAQPRPSLSLYAPRITTIKVKPDQIRLVIGPGGKTIKGIIDQTGVAIDVEDDGTCDADCTGADSARPPTVHEGAAPSSRCARRSRR